MSVNIIVSTKRLPEEVVVSPQDSVPMPQLGGAAHEGAIDTGPGGHDVGDVSAEQQRAENADPGAQEVSGGALS